MYCNMHEVATNLKPRQTGSFFSFETKIFIKDIFPDIIFEQCLYFHLIDQLLMCIQWSI